MKCHPKLFYCYRTAVNHLFKVGYCVLTSVITLHKIKANCSRHIVFFSQCKSVWIQSDTTNQHETIKLPYYGENIQINMCDARF